MMIKIIEDSYSNIFYPYCKIRAILENNLFPNLITLFLSIVQLFEM